MTEEVDGTQILMRPADGNDGGSKGEACLIMLHPPGPDIGKRTSLERVMVIGRDNSTDFPINRTSVSRQHARLSPNPDGTWTVTDLGSTNGTFVNDERIKERSLRSGDQVRFGEATYKFICGNNVETAYHEEIYKMTILDGLTGVHNKRYLMDFIQREVAVAVRYKHPVSLVMFDVDHFKKVNDTMGHLAGDAVLKDLALRIKTRIRREDLFARYGGEEFACVLASTSLEGAIIFAEQLRALIADKPCVFEGKEIPFTISLGVATVRGGESNAEIADAAAFIQLADERLYEAKRGGRNRVVPQLAELFGIASCDGSCDLTTIVGTVTEEVDGTQILMRPADGNDGGSKGEACLIMLHPPGPDIGKRTSLERVMVIGRDNSTDFPINRTSVSRQHARLSPNPDGTWTVTDLGSTNGTFVNDERIKERSLRSGDQVRFGEATYKFICGNNVETAYHEEIYKMTILDGLTGVHNKRYLMDFIQREVAVAVRYKHPVSLVMFDVDHFKKVNDTMGHLAGDAVLKDLALRIKTRIRREDLFARYGGEEFACVLASTSLEGAIIFAEQLRALIADKPCVFEGKEIPFTISLGVATVRGGESNAEIADAAAFIQLADERLYEAKRGGRNRVVPQLADCVP